MSYSVEDITELIRYHLFLAVDDPSVVGNALQRLATAIAAMRWEADSVATVNRRSGPCEP
ncbi:MAG: hypothetical protein JO265_09045 [Acidimicrobiia bacterium]|nr:hypothetical protein [Acidimicrobiia bacterium]